MMKVGFIVAAVLILTACQSEVDKCVIAEMKAWQTTNEINKEYNRINSKYNEDAERYNEEAKKNNDEISEKIIEEVKSAMNEQTGKSQIKIVPESNLAGSSKQKEYMNLRELRMKVVDDRAKEVVEAEFRRACMKLK